MQQVLESPLTTAGKKRLDVLRVNEIFYSIQGEGSRSGYRCVFVRLTGCGLRCTYCDTEYAFYEGEDRAIESILDEVGSFGCNLVEITGGEPLEQVAVFSLMEKLCNEGFEVMVETGGHIDISKVDSRVKRIVDIKTPSSAMMNRNDPKNIERLRQTDEVKFVIGSHEDYLWSKVQIESTGLHNRVGTILMSPVSGVLEGADLAKWILDDRLSVRYQIQLHKILWPGIERGV